MRNPRAVEGRHWCEKPGKQLLNNYHTAVWGTKLQFLAGLAKVVAPVAPQQKCK